MVTYITHIKREMKWNKYVSSKSKRILFLETSLLVYYFVSGKGSFKFTENTKHSLGSIKIVLYGKSLFVVFVIYSSLRSFDTFWHIHIFTRGGTLHKRSERHSLFSFLYKTWMMILLYTSYFNTFFQHFSISKMLWKGIII